MKEAPPVSILINNYNYGRFLGAAIDSALGQTYAAVEVVVVDDGSTDASRDVIADYGDSITAILKENGGQASAIHAGFEVSRGDIVLFLDADDALLPTAVKQVVEAFREPNVAKVHWPLWRIDAFGNRSGKLEPAGRLTSGDLLEAVARYGPAYFCGTAYTAPTSGNAWSRTFLEQVFPLTEADFRTGGVDYFLSVLAPVYGLVKSLAEPQGCYRVHGSNDTLRSPETYLASFFGWFEQSWQALDHHLRAKGIPFDPAAWQRNSWFHRIHAALEAIAAIVPPGGRFVLADDNHLGLGGDVRGRTCIPFMEKDGMAWGAPENDDAAIAEVERQRANGASHIFVAWTAFWMLEWYREFQAYLGKFPCVIENDGLIGFHLQP